MAKGAPVSRRAGRRVVLWALALITSCASLGAGGLAGMLWYYGRDLKAIDEAALRAYQPEQITRIYANDGATLIGEFFTQRRTLIQYERIPSHVENAFLAAEDADFHRHEGLDYLGILRALFINVRAGKIRQGASTITQQVVKNFILSPERTFKRKVHELLLSRRLERVLSKQEILELYLNEIYLGHGRYG
ncbi:MAG: transglycosylase domain-containing protein, partial [Nannocystaceae bacterium]